MAGDGLIERLRSARRKVQALSDFLDLKGASKTTLNRLLDTCDDSAARLTALEQENKRLREALVDARENLEHWGAYAGDYFIEKHDLAADLAAIDAALTHEDKP